MEYLNLDDLATKPSRSLKMGGKEYPINDQTVDVFISASKMIKELQGTDESDDLVKQINLTIELIILAVPTIDAAALRTLPLASLSKISNFVHDIKEPVEVAPSSDGDLEKK